MTKPHAPLQPHRSGFGNSTIMVRLTDDLESQGETIEHRTTLQPARSCLQAIAAPRKASDRTRMLHHVPDLKAALTVQIQIHAVIGGYAGILSLDFARSITSFASLSGVAQHDLVPSAHPLSSRWSRPGCFLRHVLCRLPGDHSIVLSAGVLLTYSHDYLS